MKIKSRTELLDKIDADFGWRRLDLTRIRALVLQNQKDIVHRTYVRAAIPLIYAHWEGFVKDASLLYINYLTQIKLPFQDLNKSFILLHIKERILDSSVSNFEKSERLYDFFLNQMNEKSNLKSIPDAIDTQSNLKSEVLKQIVAFMGLDYKPFEGYQNFIDEVLLKNRNEIAHGNYSQADFSTYDEIHNKTLLLISEYKDQIQNAISSKTYLAPRLTAIATTRTEKVIAIETKKGAKTTIRYTKVYV